MALLLSWLTRDTRKVIRYTRWLIDLSDPVSLSAVGFFGLGWEIQDAVEVLACW